MRRVVNPYSFRSNRLDRLENGNRGSRLKELLMELDATTQDDFNAHRNFEKQLEELGVPNNLIAGVLSYPYVFSRAILLMGETNYQLTLPEAINRCLTEIRDYSSPEDNDYTPTYVLPDEIRTVGNFVPVRGDYRKRSRLRSVPATLFCDLKPEEHELIDGVHRKEDPYEGEHTYQHLADTLNHD